MSLKHAILGILTLGPSSGYDLSKFMDFSISFVWNANHSQIYLELKKLKKDGMVESHIEYQISKPNKEIYRITDQGREELRNWLLKPSEKTVLKDGFLLRAFFMNHLTFDEATNKFKEFMEIQKKTLAELETIQDFAKSYVYLNPKELEQDAFYQSLVIKLGIELTKSYINWMEDSISQIESYSSRDKKAESKKASS